MDLGLTDHSFLVTGGSAGLGKAGAQCLVQEGARVLIASRDEEAVHAAVDDLGPDNAVGIAADIGEEPTAERVVAAAVARFGRLDGALISVGGPPPASALMATDEMWRESFETVFLGALRVARAVASAMDHRTENFTGSGPSILFVLSTSAKVPIPGLAISNGLRPGLAMVIKDLADELGPRGIRVNGIMPGRFATDRTFALDARTGSPDSNRRRAEASIPLARYGEPEEFGRVAAFLLSPAASYITGTVVAVDGGSLRTA